MSTNEIEMNYYSDRLVAHMGTLWGEGFLSPGGVKEVGEVISGIDLQGLNVLEIGCGVGGCAVALAAEFGAKKVTTLDVQPAQVTRATEYISTRGLSDKVFPMLIKQGTLPFESNSFDIVFSKETLNEVADKFGIIKEVYRVLKPDGWFLLSDWMKGDGEISEEFRLWEKSWNLPIEYEKFSVMKNMLEQSGFSHVSTKSRNSWYAVEARNELAQMEGSLRQRFMEIQKNELVLQQASVYWQTMIRLLDSGEFCFAHLRGQKR